MEKDSHVYIHRETKNVYELEVIPPPGRHCSQESMKKHEAVLPSSSGSPTPCESGGLNVFPTSCRTDEKEQEQERSIKDLFGVRKDGRVTPFRRPEVVDRLHSMFFYISIPALLTMMALFIVLYVRDNVNVYVASSSIGGVACFTAAGMTGLLILCHLTAYTCPTQQRLICRIILLVPVYALDSFIALIFYRVAPLIAVLRDTYEAYVIYQFYLLLMEYLEGEERVLQLWKHYGTGEDYAELDDLDSLTHNMDGVLIVGHKLRTCNAKCNRIEEGIAGPYSTPETVKSVLDELENPLLIEEQEGEQVNGPKQKPVAKGGDYVPRERVHVMRHLFPFTSILSPMPLNRDTLYLWKLFLTQYVILHPLLTIITVPLYLTGHYHDGSFSVYDAYPYLAVIRTISVTFALTALLYFYFATKAYMRAYSPTVKFLAIKAVVFLSYWQGVLLTTLVFYNVVPDTPLHPAKKVTTDLQNFLICLEMYGASVAHRWIFTDDIYLIACNGKRQKLQPWVIRHVLSVSDVIDEAGSVVRMAPRTAQRMLKERFALWRSGFAQGNKTEKSLPNAGDNQ